MTEIEVLNNIATYLHDISINLQTITVLLFLFLVFKNMGTSSSVLSDISHHLKQIYLLLKNKN